VALWRRSRVAALVTAGFVVPMWAMLSVQENWEELKMTYLVLLAPPVATWLGAGAAFLADGARSPVRRLGALAGAVVAVAVVAFVLGSVEVPADPRWPIRFPHAATNAAGFEVLPADKRWAWEFFHSAESEEELARERERLVPPALWPRTFRAPLLGSAAGPSTFAAELRQESITTLAIWKYIYTPPGGPRGFGQATTRE
jgi:4-amino-4-deoxy-L-arabinose transferase-like glycosyltransferase